MRAGHGLDILQRRLRAVFGEAATLTFDRQPGSMTVRLRVPIT
jgi:LytS/YehU family sensor histidine kinase